MSLFWYVEAKNALRLVKSVWEPSNMSKMRFLTQCLGSPTETQSKSNGVGRQYEDLNRFCQTVLHKKKGKKKLHYVVLHQVKFETVQHDFNPTFARLADELQNSRRVPVFVFPLKVSRQPKPSVHPAGLAADCHSLIQFKKERQFPRRRTYFCLFLLVCCKHSV